MGHVSLTMDTMMINIIIIIIIIIIIMITTALNEL